MHFIENLDGICSFEVIRIDFRLKLFGWRPEICVYHEEHAWKDLGITSDLANENEVLSAGNIESERSCAMSLPTFVLRLLAIGNTKPMKPVRAHFATAYPF